MNELPEIPYGTEAPAMVTVPHSTWINAGRVGDRIIRVYLAGDTNGEATFHAHVHSVDLIEPIPTTLLDDVQRCRTDADYNDLITQASIIYTGEELQRLTAATHHTLNVLRTAEITQARNRDQLDSIDVVTEGSSSDDHRN